MNAMEVLFWISPALNFFKHLFCFSSIICGLGVLALFIVMIVDKVDSGGELVRQLLAPFKKILVIFILSMILGSITSIFSDPMDTYKKVLIYRGINSTLVDKTVDTAEKALKVLNLKLDEQLLVEKK